MPRHYFNFSAEVRAAVEMYAAQRIAAVNPTRFKQEPNYNAALAQSLVGVAYDGPGAVVSFTTTSVDAIGPNAAESWASADPVITATISDGVTTVEKAILIQSKLGLISELSKREFKRLIGQVEDMKQFTHAPKVMEIVEIEGVRRPRIVSGNGLLSRHRRQSVPLERYLATRVLSTSHGDTRPGFVTAVQDSALAGLKMIARLAR
jgi:hypothetical protein